MSDEPAKTVGPPPELFQWGKPEKITTLLCLNLLAAYVPAVAALVWITGLLSWPDSPATKWTMFLISPIGFIVALIGFLLSLVIDPTSAAGGWLCLAAFIAFVSVLCWASAALHNSRKGWVAIPTAVFVYSLVQGVLFAIVLKGLSSLGGG